MKITTRTEQVIDVGDWDNLVETTYGRPYSFQQQDGCKERQRVKITIPDEYADDYENDTVPEEVNHDEVLQAAQKAEPHVRNLIKNLIAQY